MSLPSIYNGIGISAKPKADQMYSNIFQSTFGGLTKDAMQANQVYKDALSTVLPLNTTFSDKRLSLDLKRIAEVMSVKSKLGANRQIFFVNFGGWDHHDDVLTNQSAMLPILGKALSEFNDALEELSLKNNVVSFTISDFGRTLTSNGLGSDHAWGGNQMIMGGPIQGGNIYGNYPSLNLNDPLNVNYRGRLIPTTSVDEFYAEIALWFGASPKDLDYILPNLCNFYSTTGCPSNPPANYMPLGMFS